MAIGLSFAPVGKASAGEAVGLFDFGSDEMAYLSLPAEAPKGSILLLPDSLTIPEVAAARCELLAKLGYIAMTVDFYSGQSAKTLDQSRLIQGRLSAGSPQKTVRAALRMLTESPQYKSKGLIVAVWGANMDFLRATLLDPKQPRIALTALSWLEPDGMAGADPFAGLPRPLQVLANDGPWLAQLEKAQAAQPLKRIPADIHAYKAAPGFMMRTEDEELGTQAWVAVIEFWKNALEAETKATVEQTPITEETETEAKPENVPAKKSSIFPKR